MSLRSLAGIAAPAGMDLRALNMILVPVKSVSVLYALGGAEIGEQVMRVHREAVAEAMRFLADQVGGQLGVIDYDHDYNSAQDPEVHTHLILSPPAGQAQELDEWRVLREFPATDAVYRNAYQRELTRRLGCAWSAANADGDRELQGVPVEVLQRFSSPALLLTHVEACGLGGC